MTHSMTYSDRLRRRVRTGDLREQAESTWAKIVEAIDRRDAADAAALAAYTLDEGKFHVDTMYKWRAGLRTLLAAKGVGADDVAAAEERVLTLLAVPGEERFDLPRHWDGYLTLVQELQGAAHERRWDDAARLVDETRESWRMLCDRDVDWCCALLDLVVVRCGEAAVPDIWDSILWPLFNSRYERFDIDKADWETESLPTLLYVALEAMRGYLSTPDRDGAPLEFVEHEDRWVVRFDPCGSGGRAMRGEPIEDAASRMEEPFNFRVIEGAYDWTDVKEGICVYCNHCQVLMEHWPMDRFGYPLRVVDPPTYPASDPVSGRSSKCQWTMYKDPTAAPPEVYERAGRTKPEKFGSHAHPDAPRPSDTTTFIAGG